MPGLAELELPHHHHFAAVAQPVAAGASEEAAEDEEGTAEDEYANMVQDMAQVHDRHCCSLCASQQASVQDMAMMGPGTGCFCDPCPAATLPVFGHGLLQGHVGKLPVSLWRLHEDPGEPHLI